MKLIQHSLFAFTQLLLLIYTSMIKAEEYFTAIAELSKLLQTENSVSFGIEAYLKMEEERLQKIRWFHKLFEENHNAAKRNPEKFLSNPMNAYLLIKRLTSDWESTNGLIGNSDTSAMILKISSQGTTFPSNGDLIGAAEALVRLQEIYLLDAEVLARGEIKGTISSVNLTASDCYELGLHSYNAGKFNLSFVWMQEVLNRNNQEKQVQTGLMEDALLYMAYCQHFEKFVSTISPECAAPGAHRTHGERASVRVKSPSDVSPSPLLPRRDTSGHCKRSLRLVERLRPHPAILQLNNNHAAADLMEQIIQIDSEHAVAKSNVAFFRSLADVAGTQNSTESSKKKGMTDEDEIIFDAYERLCRGESLKTPQEESQLYCYYTNSNNGYLLLQPIKAEVLNLKSKLTLYYDVLKEWEINAVKELAIPRLKRTLINKDGVGVPSNLFRVSKSAWLMSKHFPYSVLPRINKRLEDITALDMTHSESLIVMNYGIGGHYAPHWDHVKPGEDATFLTDGNRIATWMFYLSDVAAGGSTVFPSLRSAVKPVKGSAVFWYNMQGSGAGDQDTIHAACPVLAGSKWIANVWFHEHGNEFKRPCSLDPLE